MSITNKAISTTFFNIIIRTYHGQTDIVIQYGCLRSSVMCVSTSCSNDSFASVFVKTFWTRITPVFFFGRHYHRISQQLHIYRMNSVNVFTTLKVHGKHYIHCVTHCVRLEPQVNQVKTIQGFDAHYFLHREAKSTKIVYFRFIWA
jgi:hypothetical protein